MRHVRHETLTHLLHWRQFAGDMCFQKVTNQPTVKQMISQHLEQCRNFAVFLSIHFYRWLNFKPKQVTMLQNKNSFINKTVLLLVSSAQLDPSTGNTVRCALSRCKVLTVQSCWFPADTTAMLHRCVLRTRLLVLRIRSINRPVLSPPFGCLRNRG